MSLRPSLSAWISACALVAVGTLAAAAPAKKTAPAPAPAAGPDADAGSGSAVEPIEEPPSATEMNGTEDNPDNPHALTTEQPAKPAVAPPPKKKGEYPVELALRPITLLQNLTEVEIAPHFDASPFVESDAVHARYGITDQIQVGVTYLYGGVWKSDLVEGTSGSYGFHSGKAFGVDVSYLIQPWVAVTAGIPVYVSPFAIGLQLGAPMKFHITDKFALGGLDDLLLINLDNFAPSFYQEVDNAIAAHNQTINTPNSRGHLRFSFYGIYQYAPRFAVIGRVGLDSDFGTGGGSVPGETSSGGEVAFVKAGFLWTPVNYLDFGAQIGFDDLSTSGSFGLQLFLAIRI